MASSFMRIFSQETSLLISEISPAVVRWSGISQPGLHLIKLQLSRGQQSPQNILKIRVSQDSQNRLRATFV